MASPSMIGEIFQAIGSTGKLVSGAVIGTAGLVNEVRYSLLGEMEHDNESARIQRAKNSILEYAEAAKEIQDKLGCSYEEAFKLLQSTMKE